jgi:hypothetical protein
MRRIDVIGPLPLLRPIDHGRGVEDARPRCQIGD